MKKGILIAIGILLIFLSGMWVANRIYQSQMTPPVEQSIILLEQIEKVTKLVTVEGHFVEYYDYSEPDAPFFIGPIFNIDALLPRKAAKLRIQAKVLVGYDLSKMTIEADELTRTLRISNIPDPDILSIEHSVSEFDNQASIFRPLNSADYVKIDRGAQAKIRQLALTSDLIDAAREQGNDLIELIDFIATSSGWRVVREDSPAFID